MAALNMQVGGGHYKNLAIQPVEFAMVNRLDACAHSVLKYVTRHRTKNGRQDLEKAIHFVDLRMELATAEHQRVDWVISMQTYCEANGLYTNETTALSYLAMWISSGDAQYALLSKAALRYLIEATYDSTGD